MLSQKRDWVGSVPRHKDCRTTVLGRSDSASRQLLSAITFVLLDFLRYTTALSPGPVKGQNNTASRRVGCKTLSITDLALHTPSGASDATEATMSSKPHLKISLLTIPNAQSGRELDGTRCRIDRFSIQHIPLHIHTSRNENTTSLT